MASLPSSLGPDLVSFLQSRRVQKKGESEETETRDPVSSSEYTMAEKEGEEVNDEEMEAMEEEKEDSGEGGKIFRHTSILINLSLSLYHCSAGKSWIMVAHGCGGEREDGVDERGPTLRKG